MSSPTAARDRAVRSAAFDWAAALAAARAVGDPWFGCQALAWAARFAPDASAPAIVAEALATAASAADPYKAVGASAWPVRAMVERSMTDGIDDVLRGLLDTAKEIPNPVSRSDALSLLWQAGFPMGASARRDVQEALIRACSGSDSWRAARTLRDVAVIVAAEDPAEAARIAAALPECPARRQALRRIASGQQSSPRPFFWRAG